MNIQVDRVVHLSEERDNRLEQIAREGGTTTDAIIEKALDLLFSYISEEERIMWATFAQPALQRVWDNDADSVYDDWRTLYELQQG